MPRPPAAPSGGCAPRSRPACGRVSHACSPSASPSTSPRASNCAGSTGAGRARSRDPAENQGYVRLNLRGRERDGIVAPEEADALMDEIADGVRTFTDLDGRPAVESVERVAERFGTGARAHLLPDLIVRWTNRPSTNLEGVRSERFGTVRRHGVGSGRSGNHTEGDAWALVVPGTSQPVTPSRPPRLEDIAATAAALAGVDVSDLTGEPLLAPR